MPIFMMCSSTLFMLRDSTPGKDGQHDINYLPMEAIQFILSGKGKNVEMTLIKKILVNQ